MASRKELFVNDQIYELRKVFGRKWDKYYRNVEDLLHDKSLTMNQLQDIFFAIESAFINGKYYDDPDF